MRTLVVSACLAATALAQGFSGDAEGRARYDRMVGALAQAKTLRYVCEQRREYGTWKSGLAHYRVWLQKPNHFRIETAREAGGTLIGDGENMWVHWPGDRPFFTTEERADWETTARNVYMRERTPPKMHSIAHKLNVLGGNLGMAIINPSLFHGAKSSLDADLFRWAPPPGWKKWRLPRQSDRLLKTGAMAPDFKLRSMKRKKIGLADYRGKVVWLVFWRVG